MTGSKFKLQFIIINTFYQLFITGGKYEADQLNTNGTLFTDVKYNRWIVRSCIVVIHMLLGGPPYVLSKLANSHDM